MLPHPCFKSNFSSYLLYYAEAYNEFAGPSPHYCARATQLFSKKCRSGGELGYIVSDWTGPRLEPLTTRSRDERVTARPTGRFQQRVKTTQFDGVFRNHTFELVFSDSK